MKRTAEALKDEKDETDASPESKRRRPVLSLSSSYAQINHLLKQLHYERLRRVSNKDKNGEHSGK